MRKISVLIGAMLAALAACAAPDARTASHEDLASDGRAIAEAQCAACHAVGTYGDSPVGGAPPFRTLLSRYRAEVLEEELAQGVQVAHPMPEFQLNPQGVDALIAYLRSIQADAPEGGGG